jgi:hypothetical protein
LRVNPNIRVVWDKAIHLVDRDPALMVVFQFEFSAVATTRKIGAEFELDLAASLFHLVRSREPD